MSMEGRAISLGADEAFVVPVDADRGVVFCANVDPSLLGTRVAAPRSLVGRFLDVASFGLAGDAARRLADGTLVQLAPQTVDQLRNGLDFAQDAQGYALGILKGADGGAIVSQARFLTGAANPVAAGLMLQTMMTNHRLRAIEQALQRIEGKIEALGKSHRVGVLAEVLGLAPPIAELRAKVDAEIPLTTEDGTRLGALEDRARKLGTSARLWTDQLKKLSGERLGLGEQHDVLLQALETEHAAFWVRAGLASDIALVQIRSLRGHRAALAEGPAWASTLQDRTASEIAQLGARQFELHALLDGYLRDRDIAVGLEELSFRRKHQVQVRRRELMEVANTLRDGLDATSSLFADATGRSWSIADPLTHEDILPPSLWSKLRAGADSAARSAGNGVDAAGRALGTGGAAAGRAIGDGGAAAGRALESGVGVAQSAASRAFDVARRRRER